MIKYSWMAVVLLCLLLFFFLMHEVQSEKTLAFDTYIAELFAVGENTIPFTFFKSITYLGKSKVIGIVSLLCVLYLWIIKKNYLPMAVFSIGMAGGDVLNEWIKNHTQRVRPGNHLLETGGYSFPSGHAMLGLIFFSMVAYFILKEVKGNSLKWVMGIGFVCLVLLIGISRIAMNVHFPTDILAGYALGAAYSLTLINLYKFVRRRSIYKKT
ncbi:phosphatase PAP2 family protein [Peribacillus sp. CSMR9]|uniref:phosphatase PAP2 family protein n=1 Tax=Peribacillus sp. CSMR9 TaxID=2981350 RepID=UPI002952F8E3|nr:phosphatase PAP2 family protein [Peribacillus sp. CSMR9]MDV7766287.1 phosphatase PAP2 family protein [Peribacillus sp. CSMR9]